MRGSSTFTVAAWTPAASPDRVGGEPIPRTAAPTGLAHMVKTFEGDLSGRSVTWFVGCLNEETGHGSYVAVEAVEGELGGRRGSFNLVHAASTHGSDRFDEHVAIVPGSGTGDLRGLTGTGAIEIDPDGTHHLRLDYSFQA